MAELTYISVVLNKVIEELIGLRDSINSSENNTPTNEVKEPVKSISLEDVRKVLAELSRDGFTIEVRKLLQKYGVNKFSKVKETQCEEIFEVKNKINKRKINTLLKIVKIIIIIVMHIFKK